MAQGAESAVARGPIATVTPTSHENSGQRCSGAFPLLPGRIRATRRAGGSTDCSVRRQDRMALRNHVVAPPSGPMQVGRSATTTYPEGPPMRRMKTATVLVAAAALAIVG